MNSYVPYETIKMPTLEARVNNILYTRENPWQIDIGVKKGWLRPLFMPFPAVYTSAISLQIGESICYIAFQDDNWLYTHSSFDDVENKEEIILPYELKQALLEHCMTPYVEYLSSLLETTVKLLESYVDLEENKKDFLPNNSENYSRFAFEYSISFNERHSCDASCLFVDLFIPQNINIDALLQKITALPMSKKSAWTKEAIEAFPIELSFEAGHVILSQKEIKQLEMGDILLPDEYYSQPIESIETTRLKLCIGSGNFEDNALENTPQNYALYCSKQAFVFCSLEGNKATVLDNMSKHSMQTIIQKVEGNNMSEENNMLEEDTISEEESTIGTEAQDTGIENTKIENTSMDNAQMKKIVDDFEAIVSFELERRVLSIADIQSITEGYTFALSSDKNSPVTLRVNGKDMGRGRLVDMDGMLGVQITKLGV